jgi:3-oxoadipate enol-lactonase
MTDRAATAITAQLVPGEELLWAGASREDVAARLGAVLLLVSTIYFSIDLIDEVRSIGLRNIVAADQWFVIHVILVLGAATIFVDAVIHPTGYFFYGVTNRRAIAISRQRGSRPESVALGYVQSVTVTKLAGGSGKVMFDTRPVPKSVRWLEDGRDDWPMTRSIAFGVIDDPDRVASLVNGLLDRKRKRDWDATIAARPLAFAKSGELNIAYVDAGSGDPIIFLHGVGATKKCWAMQMRLLSPKFHCVALDYRGYGNSDIPPIETISREAYARDVAAVMDAAGIEKATLCGNSLGGVVALEFYKQFPKRVKSLVLVDSFAFYPGGAESIPNRLTTLDELGIEKFAETRAPALFAPDAPKWLVEAARADLVSIPLDVYKASTSVTWSGDYRQMLPKVGVRALVVWGEHDTKIAPRELSKELALTIPAADDMAVIRGAGHIPQMEAPLVFNLVLADFLS